jgi:hypothetical protein
VPNPPRSGWQLFLACLGVAIASICAIVGLAAVAFFVVVAVGINSWGSNK